MENEVGRVYGMHGVGEKSEQGSGGKDQRKGPLRRLRCYMGGWDQNRSWGNWLEGCGVDAVGSG
jgi:hypothetical protein